MADAFDLVVLGGGPGGYAAALYGASAGLRIALVEEDVVGGTCLHRGCIPAKALLQTAEVLRTVRSGADFGVIAGEPALDLTVAQSRKAEVVGRLTKGLSGLLDRRTVTVVPGRGRLAADGRAVEVTDGTGLRGEHVLLATGSTPRSLDAPGLAFDGTRVLSSDHLLAIDTVPDHVVVVGGGAIGCEFASLLSDFGARVTLLEAAERILPGVDAEVAKTVTRSFTRRGITVVTGAAVTGDDGSTLGYVASGTEHRVAAELIVVAVGRQPRSADIGLEAVGVEVAASGHVAVDPWLRTSVPGVFAVGDLVATPQLAHVAFAEAITAVRTMLGEDPVPVDYDRVPWGIYCHPEVAFCGLTEEAARTRGHDVVTSVHRWGGNSRALIVGETDGVCKIVADRDGALLGVHLAGPWATELVAEAQLALNWDATAADVGALLHAHPTLSELFGESVLALTGRSLHA
ncbi:MAG: dihydrolipoyl dehydrogenase [Actinomycetota bacterium]